MKRDGRPDLDGFRCLVLGGGGFLGINLCNALRACGATVIAFGRTLAWPDLLDLSVDWIEAALEDTETLRMAIKGQDVIFHLAGMAVPRRADSDPGADMEATVRPTLGLLDILRDNSHEGRDCRLVFASSGGTVYGPSKRLPISERAPTDPVSAYGVSKLTVEKYLGLYCHLHGLDCRILRLANAYGRGQAPGRGQGVVATMIARGLSGEPLEIWGGGGAVRDFIHVDDVVEAMIAIAAYSGSARVLNVGSGQGRSISQVAADIAAVLGLASTAIIHKPAAGADIPANVLDISLIARETGWLPRTAWRDGLSDTVSWLSAERQRSPALGPDRAAALRQ